MLTKDQLRSPVFDRLTDRLEPKLSHPTALAYSFDQWVQITLDDELGVRDLHLLKAARYVAECLSSVRIGIIDGLFQELTGDQIVDLAMANANRAWNIFRWKVGQAVSQLVADIRYIPTLGKLDIPIGPGGAMVNPDDANNALVDSLPYWFDEARRASGPGVDLDTKKREYITHWGHVATNLMQVFRSVWQQVLWEPYGFRFNESMAEVFPLERQDLAVWKAWAWREETLIGQSSLLNRNLERDVTGLKLALPLTAVAIHPDRILVGEPDDTTAAGHRSAFENLERSYLRPFLADQVGPDRKVTVTLLEKSVCVLQDLVRLHFDRHADPKDLDAGFPDRFKCDYPRAQLEACLVAALSVDTPTAASCIDILSVDPFTNLGPLFTKGLWDRPLVRSRDGGTIMIVAGALMWGSPVRRVERWLQGKALKNDLSKTPSGIRFEEALRGDLARALERNALLEATPKGVSSMPGRKGEQIDLLLRIGATVIVGEIKCLLGPAEPIDRNDYVEKLQDACAQAVRKTGWLKANPAPLVARFGEGASQLRLQPLVIVNQSAGVEWEYDGCPITDARFIRLFCGDGAYLFGGKLFEEADKVPELFMQTMYDSASAAEAAIPAIFRKMPGMDPFRGSISWGSSDIPLPNENVLRLNFPQANPDAYRAVMDRLLAGATI